VVLDPKSDAKNINNKTKQTKQNNQKRGEKEVREHEVRPGGICHPASQTVRTREKRRRCLI